MARPAPAASRKADLCVIGAGSGGLSVAAGAAQLGRRVVLVERGRMGGDCLNYGCVPSKSLIAAAGMAQAMRSGAPFGIRPAEPAVDFARVRAHVEEVIASIAPTDSVERFEGLGVTVIEGTARFAGPAEVAVGDRLVRARRFVIATGSRPALPPLPGLEGVPHLTNETVFGLDLLPDRLIVLGGGPVGCELAQAFRRLGAAVVLVDLGPILPKEDPELTAVVRSRLVAEGVELYERVQVRAAEAGPALLIEAEGRPIRLTGSHLLLAAGRRPNVQDLGLERAGIAFGGRGIEVDARLRTTNRRVYAIGDCTGGLQFTHVAGHHAGIVIRNALFRLPAKASTVAIPRVTYTDPELAAVGQDEAAASARGEAVEVVRWRYEDNDRARAERRTEGLVKAVIGRRGRILGAAIVGAQAGELILPWVIALGQKMTAADLAGLVVPYPTLGEISKRAAGAWVSPRLFAPWTRRLVGALSWLP